MGADVETQRAVRQVLRSWPPLRHDGRITSRIHDYDHDYDAVSVPMSVPDYECQWPAAPLVGVKHHRPVGASSAPASPLSSPSSSSPSDRNKALRGERPHHQRHHHRRRKPESRSCPSSPPPPPPRAATAADARPTSSQGQEAVSGSQQAKAANPAFVRQAITPRKLSPPKEEEGEKVEGEDIDVLAYRSLIAKSLGVSLPRARLDMLSSSSLVMPHHHHPDDFATTTMTTMIIPLKRPRRPDDVDGPGTGVMSSKKRRLRLVLVTSRLSRPYAQPATYIPDRGRGGRDAGMPVLTRFLKLATATAMSPSSSSPSLSTASPSAPLNAAAPVGGSSSSGSTHHHRPNKAGHQSSLVRKAAILNRVRIGVRQAALSRGHTHIAGLAARQNSLNHGLRLVTAPSAATGARFPSVPITMPLHDPRGENSSSITSPSSSSRPYISHEQQQQQQPGPSPGLVAGASSAGVPLIANPHLLPRLQRDQDTTRLHGGVWTSPSGITQLTAPTLSGPPRNGPVMVSSLLPTASYQQHHQPQQHPYSPLSSPPSPSSLPPDPWSTPSSYTTNTTAAGAAAPPSSPPPPSGSGIMAPPTAKEEGESAFAAPDLDTRYADLSDDDIDDVYADFGVLLARAGSASPTHDNPSGPGQQPQASCHGGGGRGYRRGSTPPSASSPLGTPPPPPPPAGQHQHQPPDEEQHFYEEYLDELDGLHWIT